MRCDRIRRVLVVVVAGLLIPPAALFSQQQKTSPTRAVKLSFVYGPVTLKQPGTPGWVGAKTDAPIVEGAVVSTSEGGLAEVKLENGSTIQLNELSQANFTKLSRDAIGNKLNVITVEQGHASFQVAPGQQNTYAVKVADATLSPNGKAKFQTAYIEGKVQVLVLAGSVTMAAQSASLTLRKGKLMEYRPLAEAENAVSHARVVRLSFVSGTVMLKRSGSQEEEPATLNTPIQQGFELSTSGGSYAEVEFENGSTARIGEQSKMLFHQLALDASGNKLNGLTFEQGYATFHFVPERKSPTQREANGAITLQPESTDLYQVKIADATVTADGKCEFRTDLEQDHFRVEVFAGAVKLSTAGKAVRLGEGKVLDRETNSTEADLKIRGSIVKDSWDRWTEARDNQSQLTAKAEAVHPIGPRYGWGELNTYGEWVSLPNGGSGWSPYSRAGWAPYTHGHWEWFPGFGWTWISGDPWGWLTDHCGDWVFDASFGWYWHYPMVGCGYWDSALVDWYTGPGWIGWTPCEPGRPHHHPPGGGPPTEPPRPGRFPGPGQGPRPRPSRPVREIVTVPTTVVQNRQMITPQMVKHVESTAGNMIAHPPFEPITPRTRTASAPAGITGTTPTSSSPAATAPAAPSIIATAPKMGIATRHSSAPSTILMGGDPAKEGSLLTNHGFHSGRQPLRAVGGTTLGGGYTVQSQPGEFRGNTSRGREGNVGASGAPGRVDVTNVVRATGGSVAIMSHGQGGGTSRSSGFAGGGGGAAGNRGGGGSSSGGHAGGAVGGGNASSGGGHAGGG